MIRIFIADDHHLIRAGLRPLAVQALRAGAAGYVTKTEAPTELMAAVAKVHAGGRYVSPTLAERLANELEAGLPGRLHEALSAREHAVLRLLAAGKTNKEIAAL